METLRLIITGAAYIGAALQNFCWLAVMDYRPKALNATKPGLSDAASTTFLSCNTYIKTRFDAIGSCSPPAI